MEVSHASISNYAAKLQSFSMVLAQKQINRSMERNRNHRNELISVVNLWQYIVGEKAPSITGVGKTGQLHSHTTHKSKFQIKDLKP